MRQQNYKRRNVNARRRASANSPAGRVRFWMGRHRLSMAITVGAIAVIAVIIVSRAASPSSTSASNNAGDATPSLDLTAADAGNARGSATARVTVINYSDFMCPYCTQFATTTESQFIHDYVDTGKVRYAVRIVAFLTPASEEAAEAADCAEDQGKFWPYHDLLYAERAKASAGIYTPDKLRGYAAQLGLDTGKFNQCLNSHQHMQDVQAATNAAMALGVNGTPTIFINGQPVVGGQPYEAYQQLINADLAQK